MRRLWKAMFLAVLAVGVGIIWQNESYKELIISELTVAKNFVNSQTSRFERWELIFMSITFTLIMDYLYSFAFGPNVHTIRQRMSRFFFRFVRGLPYIGSKIKKEVDVALKSLEKDVFSPSPNETYRTELPKEGLSFDEVMNQISNYDKLPSVKWKQGYVSGAIYNGNPELTKLNTAVFEKYTWSNPLHPDVFPQIRKMEAEVVQWTVKLFNGSKEACGVMTSGGTESIIMAMRAYREVGYTKGIAFPEIVCPDTAHCAFNKAAEYFRMKLTKVPIDPRTGMVNLRAMARAISSNTVVLVGSAPQFPHGIIDPIQDIAKLALKHDVGLHVDCCLGGFILPFMDKAGYKIDPFDFRVKGVTSISADTHKFGYTPKGTSVVMYSNAELRQNQYFVDPNWSGGIYATASMGGSRPGCLIATTWATLMHIGEAGYVEATRKIVTTTRSIISGMENIPGIRVIGKPKAMVFAIDSADFDVLRLSDALKERGWSLNTLQFPASIHLCVTLVHTKPGVADKFVKDVKECVSKIMKDPKAKATGQAAFYGLAATIPDRSIVQEICRGYINLSYRATPPAKS